MKKTPTSPSAGTRPCHHDTCLTALAAIIMMLATSLRAAAANGDDSLIPDSMLTEAHVYEVTFTDPELGHRIIDAMRERTDIDDYTLNILEGDLYFNNHKATQALIYYRRTLESDSVKSNAENRKEVWHRMISCFDLLHDEDSKMQYAKQLMQLAIETDDKPTEAIAKFAMGKSFYNQRNTSMGFKYMRQATAMMRESDYRHKYDNLRYFYNTLIIYYLREKMYADALDMADALEEVATKTTEGEFAIDDINKKELKSLYAQKAVILQSLGRSNEAKLYYDKWKTINEYAQDDYLIMPYLFKIKRYDDIIAYGKQLEETLTSDSNKVNYHIITAYKNMAKAYRLKGDYRNSSIYFEKAYEQNEKIKRQEQHSTVVELAAIYAINEKNQAISNARHHIMLQRMILAGVVTGITVLSVILWLSVKKRRALRRQNLLMAQQMQHYAELAEHYNKRVIATPAPPAKDRSDSASALFDELEELMLKDKPYLNPQLSRDDMVAALYTNKNKLIEAIKTARGMTFTDYVNSLRLEEAVRLLAEHPELTIEQVGTRAGFGSAATFYRQFKSTYGMSPKDYILYARHIEASRADTDGNTDRGGVK